MLLSARPIKDVGSVNVFTWATQLEYTQGDTVDLYFMLVDRTQDTRSDPPGRRYMPAAGATLQVTLDNIDQAKQLTRAATQPFTNDPSIWKVSIIATDVIKGTCGLALALTEGTRVTRGRVEAFALVYSQTAQ